MAAQIKDGCVLYAPNPSPVRESQIARNLTRTRSEPDPNQSSVLHGQRDFEAELDEFGF